MIKKFFLILLIIVFQCGLVQASTSDIKQYTEILRRVSERNFSLKYKAKSLLVPLLLEKLMWTSKKHCKRLVMY